MYDTASVSVASNVSTLGEIVLTAGEFGIVEATMLDAAASVTDTVRELRLAACATVGSLMLAAPDAMRIVHAVVAGTVSDATVTAIAAVAVPAFASVAVNVAVPHPLVDAGTGVMAPSVP